VATEAVGFWSYVRQDDEGDHGRIVALADDLREQFRLLTAEKLELFVDRESIQWGEAWKERIDTAIAGTTFFIAVITPSYFRSAECRRELLKFAREAERLGLGQLLMSVYWVRVSELDDNPEESSDEAVRFVAKYNLEDLREARLEDRDSAAYRKAVAKLAEELVKQAESVRQIEDVPTPLAKTEIEATEQSEADDGPGIIDRLAATEYAMPKAVELLQGISQHMEEINEKLERASTDFEAASKRGQGMKAALSVTNRLAHELSEPATSIATGGEEYGQVLADVDSGVNARFELLEMAEELSSDDKQFLQELIDSNTAAVQGQEGLEALLTAAEPVATFSRSLRRPIDDMRRGLRGVIDGNAVVSDWAQRATDLLGKDAEQDVGD
jgi:hypothetical protein